MVVLCTIIVFPVFMWKSFSYLTRNSEFCVLKSGLGYLQATSVSGLICKHVNLIQLNTVKFFIFVSI